MQEMSQSTDDMNGQFDEFVSAFREKAPVKKPAFRINDVKKSLEYELLINGITEETYAIQTGHFEIDEDKLEVYAAFAENGLITFKTKAVKCGSSNIYSVWADVALTLKGKMYVSKNNAANKIRGIRNSKYESILNPAKDRNAYGELAEEIVTNPEISSLFTEFYAALAEDESEAVSFYGEEEFAEAYERVKIIDSYKTALSEPTLLPENIFTGGLDAEGPAVLIDKVYRVTKYLNTYKVYLQSGQSVMFIITPDNSEIFDVVVNEAKRQTLRTKNALWSNDMIDKYAEMAANHVEEDTEESLEREWYAPGLILEGEKDLSRYVYAAEKAKETVKQVNIILYKTAIDRIYNVKIITTADDDDLGNDYRYNAKADVVFKKTQITPFQYILQNYGYVDEIDDSDIYDNKSCLFESFDDGVWGFIGVDEDW